jgi:sugar/nucleoside kinase (ribokinase family)
MMSAAAIDAAARVLVVGDVMTDIIVKPSGPLSRGSDCRATIRSLPGGSGANQAIWLAHFGMAVSFVAKVGAGDLVACAEALRQQGVTPRLAGDADLPTGSLVTILDPNGERSFYTDRGANEMLNADDLPPDLLADVALLHISGYALFSPQPRQAVRQLMQQAKGRGITITIDPASVAFLVEVGVAAFMEWTRDADICFPNEDEAAVLAGSRDIDQQRRLLAAHYPLAVIKRGAAGAEVVGQDGACIAQAAADTAMAIDTTGAGDAFLAGYLAACLQGSPVDACLRQAIAAGATAIAALGGQPSNGIVADV